MAGAVNLSRENLLGVGVHAVTRETALETILAWASRRESRAVAFATVHMLMEAVDRADVRRALTQIDLVLPDGMPLVWWLRRRGHRQERIAGPDTMPLLLERAAQKGLAVGFYGSTPETLARLQKRVREIWPNVSVVYAYSPPFRALTPDEEAHVAQVVTQAGVQMLFVALGCPKQERWMAAQRGRIPAVMLGVGAAFDFLTGVKPRAPRWMQRAGLEWLFRLATEPRRLARRYLYHNPRFLFLALAQELGLWQPPLLP